MDLNEEEVISYEDYQGDEPDFDHVDDFDVQNVSDPEDSWGDEPSHDSDYSLISDEEEVRCGWIDTSLPVMKKSESNESEWEVVSMGSVISLSDCSVNSIAREILEREQDLSGMTESVFDEKDIDIGPEFAITARGPELTKKKKKKPKISKNVKFGLVLFRKNGLEIALTRKQGDKRLSLPYSSMKKGESPLDAAVRCFVGSTGCTNFDRFAALPNLIEKTIGEKTFLFFPTIVNCNLRFLSDVKREVEWIPTNVVIQYKSSISYFSQCRGKMIHQEAVQVAQDAAHILELNAHSIPMLVDPETEELADMAHRDLLDYALGKNVSVTSAEVREFLSRNEEDLQKMFESPTKEEMAAMLRKMIMQLPSVYKEEVEQVDVPVVSIGALQMLQTLVVANTNEKGKIKWRKVNDMLLENPVVLVDPSVQQILLACGWSPEKQKFSKKKKGSQERYALYLTEMAKFNFGNAI